MRKAFSDSVVHSRPHLDEQLSSEEEADPIVLSKTHHLKHCLMNVNAKLKNTDHRKISGNFYKLCVILNILIICIDVLILINFLPNR